MPISAPLKSRDDSASAGGAPEAEAEQHARIHAQADHRSTGRRRETLDALHAEGKNNSTGAVLTSPADRAQHVEERAVRERTVRRQTAHGSERTSRVA